MEPATAINGWINTIDSKNPEVIAKARHIIESNLYCVLSTCSPEGYPWVSPVFFACDQSWSIYWCSAVASRHSQNIYSNNGRVAIAIFDSSVAAGTGKGVYFQGNASEIGASHFLLQGGKIAQSFTTSSFAFIAQEKNPCFCTQIGIKPLLLNGRRLYSPCLIV